MGEILKQVQGILDKIRKNILVGMKLPEGQGKYYLNKSRYRSREFVSYDRKKRDDHAHDNEKKR